MDRDVLRPNGRVFSVPTIGIERENPYCVAVNSIKPRVSLFM